MTEFDSSNVAFFLVDGYNILGYSSTISDPGAVSVTDDRTALGDSTKRSKVLSIIEPVTLGQEGFFDDATGLIDEALKTKRGVDQVLGYGVEGNTIGAGLVAAVGTQTRYDPKALKNALHRVAATWAFEFRCD